MFNIETIDNRVALLTFDDYRCCWLIRDRKTALIDTGYPSDYPMLVAGLDQLGVAPRDIDCLALTHIHLDHAGGAGRMARSNPELTVYVHPKGARHLTDPERLLEGARKANGERFAAMGEMVPVPAPNLRTVDTGTTIDLGDTKLEVYHTPGHAKHHVIFHDRVSSGVYSGDALGSKLQNRPNFPLTPPGDYDKDLAKKSIDVIKALKPKRINFTHCGTYRLSRNDSFFEALKDCHDHWTHCIAEILKESPSIDSEDLFEVFLNRQPDLNRYPDQHFSFRLSIRGIHQYLKRMNGR